MCVCTVMISLVVVISRDFESQLKSSGPATQPFIITRMTLDPGAPGGSGWTFGLSPVVSALLLGVVSMCVAYMSSCVVLAPRCVSPSRFSFACGGILGHSDVLTVPAVFLLAGGKQKLFHSKFPVGLLTFGPNSATYFYTFVKRRVDINIHV